MATATMAETDKGKMVLSGGGSKLAIDGKVVHDEPEAEYPMLYKRFAGIVRAERAAAAAGAVP